MSLQPCGRTSGQGRPVSTTAAVLDPSVHEIISMSDVITAVCAELDFTYNVDVQRMNLLGENRVNTRHDLQMCDPAMTHLTANAKSSGWNRDHSGSEIFKWRGHGVDTQLACVACDMLITCMPYLREGTLNVSAQYFYTAFLYT